MQVVEVPQGRIECWVTGDGPPVLFIHGVGTPGDVWFRDLEPLAAGHRLIAYNRRGYGGSGEPPGAWLQHRDDAIALLGALGVQQAAVIGYSGGAAVALDLALHRPELVSSLVLLDPAVNIKKCVTPSLVKTLLVTRVLRKLRGERAGAEYWQRYVGSYSTGGTAFDKAPPERREAVLANARGMFGDADTATKHAIDESRLALLPMPVSIVDAKLSVGFLRKSSERLRRAMSQARRVTIASAGHHITVDAREELLTILRDVLDAKRAA